MNDVPLLLPIEAAPRDGTRFMALCEANVDDVVIGYIVHEVWWNGVEFQYWCGHSSLFTDRPVIVGWEPKSLAMRHASGEMIPMDNMLS